MQISSQNQVTSKTQMVFTTLLLVAVFGLAGLVAAFTLNRTVTCTRHCSKLSNGTI